MSLSALSAILLALLGAGLAYRALYRSQDKQTDSVHRLWQAALGPANETVYNEILAEVDCSFAMFGVTLDEALGARHEEPEHAAKLIEMSVELLWRFANALTALITVLGQSSRTFHRLPEVRPLAAANFRSPSAVALARRQLILHTVLLSSRMRFFQKVAGIQQATERVAREYEEAAGAIGGGEGHSTMDWQTLDHAHYDLNTLWHETQILLKAVLHFAPGEMAPSLSARFQTELARLEAAERLAAKPVHSRRL